MTNTSYRRFLLDCFAGCIYLYGLLRLLFFATIPALVWAHFAVQREILGPNYLALIASLPVTFLVVSILMWLLSLARLSRYRPFPTCRRGACQGIHDYSWRWSFILGSVNMYFGLHRWGWREYCCRCGDRYVIVGRKFMACSEAGEPIPYKRLVKFGEWADDA